MDASSGLVLPLQSLDVPCHTLGSQDCGYKQGLDPNIRLRVLGPCPCASQISWLVAVYEYPGRSRATASGPCPCANQWRACSGVQALLQNPLVQAFFLDSCGMELSGGPGRCPKAGGPRSRWGWGEYGVLTRPRVISKCQSAVMRCANRQRSATQGTMSTTLHCTHFTFSALYLLSHRPPQAPPAEAGECQGGSEGA